MEQQPQNNYSGITIVASLSRLGVYIQLKQFILQKCKCIKVKKKTENKGLYIIANWY